jgi:hypothetical protein
VIDARVGCKDIITAWATGVLASLRRNCKDYLTSSNGRYAKGNQTKEMVDAARHGYRTNIKMGETPFSHVDTFWNAMKGSAKISTVSGAVQAGTLNCDFNDGQKHHERGGYRRGGEVIVPKAKRRKLDGDETGMFNRLHKTVSDALMTMVRAKRLHFRRQYDGDEQDQSLMRSARRKVQADKGREKAEHTAMEQAQYRVLERITSKEELQSVIARPSFDNSKAKKEALLKDQLLIRYVGFPREAVPKKSWSCAKEGRSWEELKVTLEELLEGEIATPLAWDRLVVPVSALKSAKLPQLGETVTHQRKLLDEALQQKAASSIETSADAA